MLTVLSAYFVSMCNFICGQHGRYGQHFTSVHMAITTQNDIVKAIKLLAKGDLDPKSLSKSDQNLIIQYLRYEEGWSQAKIAQILNLVTDTVRARIRKIDESYRQTLVSRGFDAWSIVAEVKRKKEIVQQKAGQQGNWNLVWKTEIDYLAVLIKLGLIKESELEGVTEDEQFSGKSAKELRLLYQKVKQENEKASQVMEEESQI